MHGPQGRAMCRAHSSHIVRLEEGVERRAGGGSRTALALQIAAGTLPRRLVLALV